MKAQKRSIYQKVIDLVRAGTNNPFNERSNFVASLLIVLSGVILYADKALTNVDLTNWMPDKFVQSGADPAFFVWLIGVTISPLLIIFGSMLRPYFYAYIVPIYCYVLQFYFILIDYSLVDNSYSYAYSFGITAILFLIIHFAKTASQRQTKIMLEEAKEKIRKLNIKHASDKVH